MQEGKNDKVRFFRFPKQVDRVYRTQRPSRNKFRKEKEWKQRENSCRIQQGRPDIYVSMPQGGLYRHASNKK